MLRSLGDVSAPKGEANGVKLMDICGRQVRRPRGIVLDQHHGDLGGVFAFVD
jgi:hypothetical protein